MQSDAPGCHCHDARPITTYLLAILLYVASLYFSFITYEVEMIILTA